ncbi:endo-1,4-beta-xylanase [Treponema sp. R6D11]
MTVYKDFSDIIERITFWGITDNQSWRSAGLPLLFDKDGKAKPAYYKFVGAIPTNW